MEMLNRVSEVQNLPSLVSDRDALADEIGSAGLRLFCLLCGGTKTDTLISLRYARDKAMVAKSNKVLPRLCLQLSVWHTNIGCVFTFKS